MNISRLLTDEAILTEMGERIARRRIEMSVTQADLAVQAGVSKRTIERIEDGASAQMASLVRIFRVLDLLQNLDQLIPQTGPGPMELLKARGKTRQRASHSRKAETGTRAWSWDEKT